MATCEFTGDFDEALITLNHRSWFGFGPITHGVYRGTCTVWRDAKTGKRCSTLLEARLSDIWTKARWKEADK